MIHEFCRFTQADTAKVFDTTYIEVNFGMLVGLHCPKHFN